jgi:hypothetical protein
MNDIDPTTGQRYNDEGMRVTDCCGCLSTYHDSTLCCKRCWSLVGTGEGDGSEYRAGLPE